MPSVTPAFIVSEPPDLHIDPAAFPLSVSNAVLELPDEEQPDSFVAHDSAGRDVLLYRHTTDERPAPLEGWSTWYDLVPAPAQVSE